MDFRNTRFAIAFFDCGLELPVYGEQSADVGPREVRPTFSHAFRAARVGAAVGKLIGLFCACRNKAAWSLATLLRLLLNP
jgi:hypothetical protein